MHMLKMVISNNLLQIKKNDIEHILIEISEFIVENFNYFFKRLSDYRGSNILWKKSNSF